jgi:hypothetical protein
MAAALPSLLAAFIAAGITLLELTTSSYRHTHFLLWKHWQIYLYFVIYGAIAAGLMAFVDVLIANKYITLQGLGTGSPWVRAVIVGITVKALTQITFFNVAAGAGSMPVGISTFIKIYEPTLLDSLNLAVWNDGRDFIAPFALRYSNINQVRQLIAANLPPTLSTERKAAVLSEIGMKLTVVEVMEVFLNAAGRSTFRRTFP